MSAARVFTVLLFFLPWTTVNAQAPCTPGDVNVKANIKYQCSKVGDKTTYYPISCVSNTGVEVLPGKTWSDPNFKWSCMAGDSNTMIWQVESCFTPSGTPIALDAFVYQDGGAYFCQMNGTSANGARIVERTFTKNLQCKDKAGKAYNLGDSFSDATTFYKCSLSNNVPTISVTGCKLPSGKQLGTGGVGENYMCTKYSNGTVGLTPYTLECTDTAKKTHDINEYWVLGAFQYQCTLDSKTQKPVISLKKCAMNITYKDAKGKSQIQQLLVATDNIATGSDKVIYWCQPVGTGTSKTYKLIPLPADKQKCTNGQLLSAKWTNGTGQFQCQWVSNVPTIRAVGCIGPDGKAVAKGAIIDMKTYGLICECPKPDVANLRNMTAAEYTKYKSSGNYVSASGNAGAGIEWYDASGKLQCASGYEVSNNKCVDVNECVQEDNPCDDTREKCVNSDGSYNCYCSTGFARYRNTNTCEEIACPCH